MNSYGNLFYMIYNAFSLFVKDTIKNREKDDKKPTSSDT